jgi:hypothetical protein
LNRRAPFEFAGQAFTQTSHRNTNLFEQRPRYSVALVQKRGEKMFVGNFLIIGLRSQILRRLQRLLHFLGELVDAHPSR